MSGILFIVSAPSGGGKTSLVRALLEEETGVALSISHTTRVPRAGEVDGTHYHFVSRSEFERMRAAGDFLESAEIYGNLYGTSRNGIENHLANERDVLLEIDWQGARQVRGQIPAVAIFIMPPSVDVLRSRLLARAQDSAETIAQRLAMAQDEMAHFVDYDYVIINDDFSRAALDLRSIIRAERLKLSRQRARYGDLIQH